MSGALTFTSSEFEVLEEIEIDETIQRPEAVRFFTIEEQETDAFELMMPKGRTTEFQRQEVRDIIERMRALYDDHVLPLPDDYALREPERGLNLPWVHPVYADVELRPYSFALSWVPLFAEDAKQAPGFYSRMIAALPRPYQTAGGTQHEVPEPTEFVNAGGEKRIRVLPVVSTTTGIVHEDQSVEIAMRTMPGSEDVVNRLGYYLDKRPLEIPNPLEDHPFLKANEATFVESTASLKDVLPSLDAVMTHAVPVTTDPYGVGESYLKLYDIQRSSIPWSSWKSRFPPVEPEQTLREKVEIPFPAAEGIAPSDTILKAYKTKYAPGVSVREWLMRQDDGGEFVVKALLSKAMENGNAQMLPGIDLPMPGPPATTLADCALTGLSFPEFLTRGILRKTPEGKLVCVPVETVRQERARTGYLNRKAWGDGTETEILTRQLEALRAYRRQEADIPVLAEEKTPGVPESVHRREVLAILHDPRRHPRDKIRDLQTIVKDDLLSENVYRDEGGQFVLCAHTLSVLAGDMEKDRDFFYDVWTTKVEGWRVCKVCGERIGASEFVDQEEYDDAGFLLNKKESLDAPKMFLGESVAAFAKDLAGLLPLFTMEDPVDAVIYQLLSLMQLTPTPETLTFFLTKAHETAKPAQTESGLLKRGYLGLAFAVLLLQANVPLLVPRRSFWSKPMSFTGYPRDTSSSTDFGIVDIVLMVLENTYRGFPAALAGPIRPILRAVVTDYFRPEEKKVARKAVVAILEKLLPDPSIQAAFAEARALVQSLPPPEPVIPFLPVRPPPATMKGYPKCPGGQSVLAGKNTPEVRQESLSLRRGLQAASARIPVRASPSLRVSVGPTPDDQIRRRLALSSKLTRETPRTNLLLASRLASLRQRPLEIASVDPTQPATRFAQIARGFANEAAQGFKGDPDKDVTLFCLLANYDESRAQARKIRATERITYINRMAKFTDLERETNMELAKRGMAPVILTLAERSELGASVNLSQLTDIGVGLPQDLEDEGDVPAANAGAVVDNGNFGDNRALPVGRDYTEQATTWDDEETSV